MGVMATKKQTVKKHTVESPVSGSCHDLWRELTEAKRQVEEQKAEIAYQRNQIADLREEIKSKDDLIKDLRQQIHP
jgi:hypothetical protein